VPIDRAATLRNAEKLLRQGKLEPAIAEYVRVVEDQPRDWNTANTLGDLYVRSGQIDKALEQFIVVADTLNEEGHGVKAAALYKKIIKLKPDHEHALMQAAELLGSQKNYRDAREFLKTLIELRTARQDARGAAQARIILGGIDPSDYAARMEGAAARASINDMRGAVRDLQEVASELTEAGRQAEAVEALRQAAMISPDDESIREQLYDVYVSADDFGRAAECATRADQFKSLAESLDLRERHEESIEMLRAAARLDPDDGELRSTLARTFLQAGDLASAAEYLTLETAGRDPKLRLTVAEIRLQNGHVDEGMDIARALFEEDPSRLELLALAGCRVAEKAPDAGYALVEFCANTSVAQGDWAQAAAELQEFVTRVPSHTGALERLVEICVDGGLEATMFSAQGQLADAYIAAGMASEARFIAEDLVAREPWERANLERFRRALELAGEADPEGIIADRLSGEEPFTSTDLTAEELPTYVPPPEPPPPPEHDPNAENLFELAEAEHDHAAVPTTPKTGEHFQLSSNAIDINDILGDIEEQAVIAEEKKRTAAAAAHRARMEKLETTEEDLSDVLSDFKPAPKKAPAKAAKPKVTAGNIDDAFAQLKDESAKKDSGDPAQAAYAQGIELKKNGDLDGAIARLTEATKTPKLRFMAAAALGAIYKQKNMSPQSIEWLERAAQAPAPDPNAYNDLLLELAEGLEASGEVARALAICLELQADAGSYRDVDARVGRLVKVQKRG
jgi:tetratricopeptide (TPR) repeat protein